MKILFIAPLYDRVNGMSLASEVLLEGLIQHQHEPLIVNLAKSKEAKKKGVGIFIRLREMMQIVKELWCQKNEAEVIYFTISESVLGNLKDLFLFILLRRHLFRCVIHLHGGGGMRELLSDRHPLLRKINLYYLNQMAEIIVLGKSLVPIYASLADQTKIHIVPNFAAADLLTIEQEIAQKFSQPRPLKVLMLSNFLPGKGQFELLQAFLNLDSKTQAMIEIDFAGDLLTENNRRLFFQKIESFPQLHYHGIVRGEQKKKLFQEAHLFCLPTYNRTEGQPITILEAYAAGCAVMTTTQGGIVDIFSNSVNGIEVEKCSIVAIEQGLKKALASPSALEKMAQHNLKIAQEHYTVTAYHSGVLSVLESVISKK